MASQPIDQASILAGGRALVPDFLQQQLQQSLGQSQVRQNDAQTTLFNQKAQQGLVASQQEKQYEIEVQQALESGDMRRISQLIARFPDHKDALKTHFDQMDGLKQRTELRQAAGIWSALNAGNTDAAVKSLETRIASDREAGEDTSDDEEQLSLLKSGDPKAVNSVKGRLGLFMASVVPEKFASVVEQVGGGNRAPKVVGYGGRLVSDDGTVLFTAPDAPFTINEGDTRFGASGGGTPTPVQGGGDIVAAMLPITMATESNGKDFAPGGGILTSPAGAQGRMQVMPGTQVDPGFGVAPARNGSIEEKARVGRDYLGAMMQRYGDPAKAWAAYNAGPGAVDAALANGANWLQGLPGETRAYVAKNMQALNRAGQAAFASAGPQAVASMPKSAPEQTRILSPQEVAAIPNLDPNVTYQQSKEGTITPVGGQRQGQLKAWPAPALAARSSNDAALKNIMGAASLFDPKNKTAAAKAAQNAVGFGTGSLGTTVTNWRDPEGVDARARVGQIGGLIIKDTSGAAVSLSEDQRLAKWVPLVTDSPGVVYSKMKNLEREIRGRNEAMDNTYSEDQGFRPFRREGGAPVQVRSIQQANALPPGTLYIAPDGKTRRR